MSLKKKNKIKKATTKIKFCNSCFTSRKISIIENEKNTNDNKNIALEADDYKINFYSNILN